ncbi:MAG: hypothetical protein MK098_11680 [Marinovum sp.]|nr:hypothetical protein [Marinovum sp.]
MKLRSLAIAVVLGAQSVGAQESGLGAHLDIELNATNPQDSGCLLSFVVQNGHAHNIDSAVFEAVLFDAQGQVNQLTLFDFGALPQARPRVRQFVVPGLQCNDLSRLIFNGASTCEGDGVNVAMCSEDLTLRSRVATEIQG